MKTGNGFYKGCYRLARAMTAVFYRLRVSGRENIPEGAALVCANHSSLLDPFLIAFAFGVEHHMHIIAKAELFRIPVVSGILRRLGMISVNRGILDIATIKDTLNYLKNGEKVVIFPEGTRATEDGAVSAKGGAVKIAERAGVPLVPLHIPRKKPLFGKIQVNIGEPYYIDRQPQKRVPDDYIRLSGILMERIKLLSPEPNEGIRNSELVP